MNIWIVMQENHMDLGYHKSYHALIYKIIFTNLVWNEIEEWLTDCCDRTEARLRWTESSRWFKYEMFRKICCRCYASFAVEYDWLKSRQNITKYCSGSYIRRKLPQLQTFDGFSKVLNASLSFVGAMCQLFTLYAFILWLGVSTGYGGITKVIHHN